MSLFAEFVVAVLGGSAAAYAVVRFLAESLIRHRLDRASQVHIAELTQKTEGLKTQLSIYAHEQNVALARVDSQGAHALHEIYAAFRAWVRPASRVVTGSPLQGTDEGGHLNWYTSECEAMHSAGKALLEVIADYAIYVDSDLYSTLSSVAARCAHAGANVLVPLRRGPAEGWSVGQTSHEFEVCRQAFTRENDAMILPIIQSVTERFRTTLGTLRAKAT